MRKQTFYILTISDDNTANSMYYTDICFYTTSKILLDKFLLQYKDVVFDIYELYGDNIIEVAEEFNNILALKGSRMAVEIHDKLELFVSHNLPHISFISTDNYVGLNIDCDTQLSDQILQILMSSYMNMIQLLPYIKDNKELELFLNFIFIYIKRFVIACNNDIYSLPKDALSELGLNNDDVFCDIIDESLIHYMQEFGWGGFDGTK